MQLLHTEPHYFYIYPKYFFLILLNFAFERNELEVMRFLVSLLLYTQSKILKHALIAIAIVLL